MHENYANIERIIPPTITNVIPTIFVIVTVSPRMNKPTRVETATLPPIIKGFPYL